VESFFPCGPGWIISRGEIARRRAAAIRATLLSRYLTSHSASHSPSTDKHQTRIQLSSIRSTKMKVPTERRTSDGSHYSPYPPTASPHFAQPAPPRPNPVSRTSTGGALDFSQVADDGTQYKVARAISSCTRCRSRKQKCDGKLPACSACERAKVECIGFDAISKTNVSRKCVILSAVCPSLTVLL
jgi:hypothetical protein